MRTRVAAVALALASVFAAGTAEAHKLKLFVDVAGSTVAGYGFFVGGGRPQGAAIHVRDEGGHEVATLATDAAGGFSWTAPRAGAYVVTLDAGDGHFVDQRIAPERFAPQATGASISSPVVDAAPGAVPTPSAPGSALDPRALADLVEASVDRAVARRLAPLVDAQVAAEARLRFQDVVAGIGMIVGLAGLAAWGLARRRERGEGR